MSYSHEDELETLGPFREPEDHENLWIGESLKERGYSKAEFGSK